MEPEDGSRSMDTPGVVNRGFQPDEAASSAPRPGQGSGGGEGDQDQLGNCALLGLDLACLNMFRGPKWFLVFLSIAAFMQGLCINGLVNVVITSIERRFGLQSTQSGLIASSYDLGSLLVMVPVSYLGGRAGASKPRWIAAGLVVMGLGSLAWTLPHWATPPLEVGGGGAGSVPSTSSAPALCSPGAGGREGGEAEGDTLGAEVSMEAGTGSLQAYRSGGTSHVMFCTVYCVVL